VDASRTNVAIFTDFETSLTPQLLANLAAMPAVSLAEVLATSDVPPGVINVLTGRTAELAAPLAAHMDVNALDLCGAPEDVAADLEQAAAENVKRVLRRPPAEPDWTADPGTRRLGAFVEIKTVWHPMGV
jgi:hypothetical protein